MGLKSFFNKEKVEERKKFQENINKLGDELEKCNTIEEITNLHDGDSVKKIFSECNRKREMFSDSKKSLKEFKKSLESFFADVQNAYLNSKDINTLSNGMKEMIDACKELQKAGSNRKMSEIALIKNINLSKLIAGFKKCSSNITSKFKHDDIIKQKLISGLKTVAISLSGCKKTEDFGNMIAGYKEAGIPGFEDVIKEIAKEGKQPLHDFNNAFKAFANSTLSTDTLDSMYKAFTKFLKDTTPNAKCTTIQNLDSSYFASAWKSFQKNMSELLKDTNEQPNDAPEEAKAVIKPNLKNVTLQGAIIEQLLTTSSSDGNISKDEDKKIKIKISDFLTELKPYMTPKNKIQLIIFEKKLEKASDIIEESKIVSKIMVLLEHDPKLKESSKKTHDKAINTFAKLNKAYEYAKSALKLDGSIPDEKIDDITDSINKFIRKLPDHADGELTENEISKIKKDIGKIIETSPLNKDDKNTINEELESKLKKGVSPNDALAIVEDVMERIVNNVPTEKAKEQMRQILNAQGALDMSRLKSHTLRESNAGEKAIEGFIRALNESNFFDGVKNAKTLGEAHEEIESCTKNIFKCFDKLPHSAAAKKAFPGLHVWAEHFTKELYEINSDLKNFDKFQIHITAFKNLLKNTPSFQRCANSLQNSYTTAVSKIKELKETEMLDKLKDARYKELPHIKMSPDVDTSALENHLKKEKTEIANTLANLWVIDKRAVSYSGKSPSQNDLAQAVQNGTENNVIPLNALEVAKRADNKIPSQKKENKYSYPHYILVNQHGEIVHGKEIHLYTKDADWHCINDSMKPGGGDIQVINLLKNVLKKAKWPKDTTEAKEWTKKVL